MDTEPDALEPTSAVLKRRPAPWRLLTVSDSELSRLEVINRVFDGRLSQVAAARLLGVTDRQVRRLLRRVEARGADGVVSRRRGRPSNNRLPRRFIDQVIALVREHYVDFGPTFAAEQLAKRHGVRVSRTSLRRMMIAADVWTPRAERRKPIQQPRLRRACYGELIQVDGSDHHWFEDRAPACTLIVYIDDATSRLQVLRFVPSESTFSYMEATKPYLRAYGRPVAFYSDKHSVFRVNKRGAIQGDGMTQFGHGISAGPESVRRRARASIEKLSVVQATSQLGSNRPAGIDDPNVRSGRGLDCGSQEMKVGAPEHNHVGTPVTESTNVATDRRGGVRTRGNSPLNQFGEVGTRFRHYFDASRVRADKSGKAFASQRPLCREHTDDTRPGDTRSRLHGRLDGNDRHRDSRPQHRNDCGSGRVAGDDQRLSADTH